jgi:hypothetical protein
MEKIREQKCARISELCEEKDIDIHDDYFTDIFRESKSKKEIFRAMSSRGFYKHPELIDETLDEIIENLEKYKSN